MRIFKSEKDLTESLDKHDRLVLDCANEIIEFWDFYEWYDNFYFSSALDGHESDDEERDLLGKYKRRIDFHRSVSSLVLHNLCSDSQAKEPNYVAAGRFGSIVALKKLKDLVRSLSFGTA